MIVEELKKAILNEAFTHGFSKKIVFEPKCFKEIFNITNGFTPSRTDKSLWSNNEINWFTFEDYNTQGYLINYTNQHISKKALGKSLNRLLPEDTVILCCTGATIGTSAICNVPMATNQQFNGLVVKKGIEILPKYIYFYTLTLKNKMKNCSTSTTFPFLSVKKLEKYIFPFTNLKEQQRIVDKIEKLFSKLDEIKQIEEELNKIKKSFPNEIKKSILAELYKDGLDVKKEKLGTIVNFSNIKNSECGEYKYLEVKYLRGNIKPKILKKGKYVKKGILSILVDGENSGEIFKISEEGYLGSTLKPLVINKKIEEKYLIYYFLLKKEYFKSNKRGSAIPHLNKKLFFDSMIYLPTIEEQRQIIDKVEQMLSICDDIEKLVGV